MKPHFLLPLLAICSMAHADPLTPNLRIHLPPQGDLAKENSVAAWINSASGIQIAPQDLHGVVKMAAGANHGLAIKKDGTVVGWEASPSVRTQIPAGLGDAVGVACSGNNSAAVRQDGSVVTWGFNPPTPPASATGVISIAAGHDHFLALRGDGTVVAWGGNGNGEATVPAGLAGVVAIAAGQDHSLAVKADGSVVGWGRNDYGQSTVPTGLSGVKGVAGGTFHSLALKTDGTVVAWGQNGAGQATVPAGLGGVKEIAGGIGHSVALKASGDLVFWGIQGSVYNLPPGPLPPVQTIAAGGYRTFGAVDAPGTMNFGRVAQGAPATRPVVIFNEGTTDLEIADIGMTTVGSDYFVNAARVPSRIAPGRSEYFTATYAPSRNGSSNARFRIRTNDPRRPEWEIVMSGDGYNGTPVATDLSPLVTVEEVPLTIGLGGTDPENDKVSLYSVGSVVPAAAGSLSILDYETRQVKFTPAKNFNGMASFTYVVHDGGSLSEPALVRVFVTPVNDPPVFTYMPKTIRVYSPGSQGIPVNFRLPVISDAEDGNITPRITYLDQPVTSGLILRPETHTLQVSGTDQAGVMITSSFQIRVMSLPRATLQIESPAGTPLSRPATLLEWNQDGFLSEAPANPRGIKQIALGGDHGFVLRNDGSLVGWGAANLNQLTIPTNLTSATKISCGTNHTLALSSEGRVMAWGDSSSGQLGVGEFAGIVDIAAGADFSLGLSSEGGRVRAVGSNRDGVVSGAGVLTGIKAIAAGGYHALALRTDGTVVAWGRNNYGQIQVPPNLTGVIAIAAGAEHSVVLKSDGRLVLWGRRTEGQTGNVESIFTAISAGTHHNIGMRKEGPASWGRFLPNSPQLNPYRDSFPPEVAPATLCVAGNKRSAAAVPAKPYVLDLGEVPVGAVATRTVTLRSPASPTLHLTSVAKTTGGSAFSVDTTGMSSRLGLEETTSFTVSFSPQTVGTTSAILRIVSNDANEGTVYIQVLGKGQATASFESWLKAAGLGQDAASSDAVPFGDGQENLIKFAFNLSTSGPDVRIMVPGTGNSGLPHISLQGSGDQSFLQVEFVRRKNGGIEYVPEHSGSLQPGSFQAMTHLHEVSAIDDAWERVIYREPVNPETQPQCFARVRVTFQ